MCVAKEALTCLVIQMSVEGTPSGVGRWRLNLKILFSKKAWSILPSAGRRSPPTWKRQNAYWMLGENPVFPRAVSGLTQKTELEQAELSRLLATEPGLTLGVSDQASALWFLAPAQPAPIPM
jgi:hypothetical protein